MRTKRHEFPKSVKKAATERAGGRCEAQGYPYSTGPEPRCTVTTGLQHDHYPLVAGDEGSDTLENCMVICMAHHRWKSAHYDVPMLAKGRRLRGETRTKRKAIPKPAKTVWPSRPFQRRVKA